MWSFMRAALALLGLAAIPALGSVILNGDDGGPVTKLVNPDGTSTSVLGKYEEGVSVFYGIPYANPPIGDLRYRPPTKLDPIPEEIDAREVRSICPQINLVRKIHLGEEDCLFLEIYVPENGGSSEGEDAFPPSSPLPVMFWINGGAFVMGDGREAGWFDGKNLAKSQNVIIVAPNYRVGAFGFLAHEEFRKEDPELSTGNAGLRDQRMALQWVQDNIAAFGGDPNQVTMFGQSAGAMSACAHLSNPMNAGLFSKVIIESGTCNSPEFFLDIPTALEFGRVYSETIGCPSETPEELSNYKTCMRELDVGDVLYGIIKAWTEFRWLGTEEDGTAGSNASKSVLPLPMLPSLAPLMPFGPVVDGANNGVPRIPYDAIKDGEHNKVPLIIGTTSDEGSIFVPMIPSVVEGVGHLPFNSEDLLLVIHHVIDPVLGVNGTNAMIPGLLKAYEAEGKKSVDHQLSRILRDYTFVCTSRRAAREFARTAGEGGPPVFMYEFSYQPNWLDFMIGGAYHTSEIYFVFGNPWPGTGHRFIHRFSKEAKEMSESIQNYWGSFARTGNPNGVDGNATTWNAWTVEDQKYLELNMPIEERNFLALEGCNFMDDALNLG